ncbi:MAG: hypothetical protein PHC88_00875, partial [Terrimicrobiaceae bacterium]|nr:hypothetical protein [Terrimicrobiaceae bacterium]
RIRKAFVKIKYADFTRTTRECVCPEPTVAVFLQLLDAAHGRRSLPVRLLGTGVRFADDAEAQPDLFDDPPPSDFKSRAHSAAGAK